MEPSDNKEIEEMNRLAREAAGPHKNRAQRRHEARGKHRSPIVPEETAGGVIYDHVHCFKCGHPVLATQAMRASIPVLAPGKEDPAKAMVIELVVPFCVPCANVVKQENAKEEQKSKFWTPPGVARAERVTEFKN